MARPKVLFVDTNIFLDFYRGRNEAALSLLNHVEAVADRLIVSYQLEIEFKKNRQEAILEGLKQLQASPSAPRLGIFSDAKASLAMAKNMNQAAKRVKTLQEKLTLALTDPAKSDPVYKICQRLFRKETDLDLGRENPARHTIRRKAFKRFLHGCPPRKRNDTSFGDAFNWEWMLECASKLKADLFIVSRDSDYGVVVKDKAYVNDHLRQEFADRVSQKGKVSLYTRLSEALKHFEIVVSKEEEAVEQDIVNQRTLTSPDAEWSNIFSHFAKGSRETIKPDWEPFLNKLFSMSDQGKLSIGVDDDSRQEESDTLDNSRDETDD